MKKTIITATIIISAIIAIAQTQVWIYQSDGTRYGYNYGSFDSITYVAPGTIALSQLSRTVPCEGEQFQLEIVTNMPWTAIVSDNNLIQLSKQKGNVGKDTITINIGANKESSYIYNDITFKLTDGTTSAISIISKEWQDKLSVSPALKAVLPLGGTYKMYITSNTDWTVSVSEPWVTFDKTKGTLNDSIVVIVRKRDKGAASAEITITTSNGKTATSTVIHDGDNVSVSPYSKTLLPLGGTYKIGVTSNTDWTVSASEPWVTFDKTKGTLNDSIVVMVGKGDKDAASAEITITTSNGKTTTSTVIHESDKVSVDPYSKTIPPTGDIYKIGVSSNTDWTISASEPWVTFDKTKGTLNDSIVVTVGKWDKDATSEAESIRTTDARSIHLRKEDCIIDGTPYLHYWNGEGQSTYWPGVPMNLSENGKWWYYDITDIDYIDPNFGIIFTNENGSPQTANIEGLDDDACFSVEYNNERGYYVDNKIECDLVLVSLITVSTANGKTATCTVVREADRISVSPMTKEIRYESGTIDIAVTSDTDWTASSNKSWATLSVSSGSGNGTIVVTVSENTSLKTDTAVVTLTTASGITTSTTIIRLGVEKCKASDYPQVTIGTQVWMAENYRCSKYDTESEAYKEGRYTIPTSKNYTYTPYYTDASDKNKWDKEYNYSDNLTDAQVKKLGYLYNWAAAVGVADGGKQTTDFTGNRQGICPNGWHVPSRAEWQTLYDYIYNDKSLTSNEVGKYLKTTSGWYQNGNGLDSYGFAALPAGDASGSEMHYVKVNDVGFNVSYWSSVSPDSGSAYNHTLRYSDDHLTERVGCFDFAYSVRCLKDYK